jgi:hypothetical protein
MRFTFGSSNRSAKKKPGIGSKIGTSLFFLVFGGMGTLFFFLIIHAGIEAVTPNFWDKVPCVIEHSSMTSGEDYEFEVRYRYRVEGRSYVGESYRPGYSGSEDVDDVTELKRKYPAGSSHQCRVNPKNPAESVLLPGSPWILAFVCIPLVFMAVGFGGLYFTWKPKSEASWETRPTRTTASGETKPTSNNEWVAILVGGIFSVVGLAILVFWFIPLLFEAWDARQWPEVPCQVVSSKVRSHDSDDGTTYSVDIHYRYEFEGQNYDSNRYSFMGGSSSGYGGKAAIVRQFPAGSSAICYVNPDRPHQSVLNRGIGLWVLFGLIPVVFAGAGIFLCVHFLRKRKAKTKNPEEAEAAGPTMLSAGTSPVGRFVGMILAAAFWNGIVSVFLWQLMESFKHGSPEWFLAIFLIPFVSIGLGFIGAVFYYGLALFNPRMKLALDRQPATLGDSFQGAWQLRGAVSRLETMKIDLVGREMAEYEEGSGKRRTTRRHKNTFYRQTLFESTDPREFRAGNISGHYPFPAPPSLEGSVGKIIWKLEVKGKIRWWPDVKEEFKIELHPKPVKKA